HLPDRNFVRLGFPQDPDDLFFAVSLLHGVLLASKGKRTHLPTGYTFRLRSVRQTIVQRIIEDRRRACDIPGTARIVRGLAMTGVVHCSAAGRSKPCQPVSDEPGLLIQETVPAFG